MARFLEQFASDARLALRQLVKAPAFSLLAILSLALGMIHNRSVDNATEVLLSLES